MKFIIIQALKTYFNLRKLRGSIFKRDLEKSLLGFRKYNISPEHRIVKKLKFSNIPFNNRNVYFLKNNKTKSNSVVIWFFGGQYLLGPFKEHFKSLSYLCTQSNCDGFIPDYPKIPEHNWEDTYAFILDFYKNFIINNGYKNIYFIGESAGGGLSLGLCLALKKLKIPGPQKIFAFSPWVDLSYHKFDSELKKKDFMLVEKSIQFCAQKYSNGDLKNDFVSPFYGDIEALDAKIRCYVGTEELLLNIVTEFSNKYENIELEIVKAMPHAFIIMPFSESKQFLYRISRELL